MTLQPSGSARVCGAPLLPWRPACYWHPQRSSRFLGSSYSVILHQHVNSSEQMMWMFLVLNLILWWVEGSCGPLQQTSWAQLTFWGGMDPDRFLRSRTVGSSGLVFTLKAVSALVVSNAGTSCWTFCSFWIWWKNIYLKKKISTLVDLFLLQLHIYILHSEQQSLKCTKNKKTLSNQTSGFNIETRQRQQLMV